MDSESISHAFSVKKNWGNPYWPTMKMENKKEDMKESKKKQNS